MSVNKKIDSSYTPKTFINRVYKAPHIIVYDIEHVEQDSSVDVIAVSSQKNPSDIKKLYRELRYEPITDLSFTSSAMVNVFGVVAGMTFKDGDPKCTLITLFDFDPNHPIIIKLWRGLSTWVTSLSIGARLQIRNLHLKDSVLHSGSTTEIYLLAHGQGNKSAALSARATSLNEKEREILLFLSHQSLLIPNTPSYNPASLTLIGPLYLEHRNDKWKLEGFNLQNKLVAVMFSHFDAKVWQFLIDLFTENNNDKFGVVFDKLRPTNDGYEFTTQSTLDILESAAQKSQNHLKKMNWTDLISSKVVLFGTFELEAVLDQITLSAPEESLGNLSILPHSSSSSSQIKSIPILRNPQNFNQFIYPENSVESSAKSFKIQVKTVLNEGNVNEIVNKTIFIIS